MTANANNTEISIIIPLYNKEQYIKKTIDSVLCQSFPYFELIVVDDGSTDGSASIVETYKDNRIKLIKKSNQGVSSARNHGANNANGEWILFLDADDELAIDSLEEFSKISNLHPNISAFVFEEINKKGEKSYKYSKKKKCSSPLMLTWMGKLYARPGALFIKHSVFSNGFDNRMSFYEDYLFMIDVFKSNTIMVIPITSVVIHNDPCSLSQSIHPINKEMAYYIPEILAKGDTTFWERALFYENIEQEISFWSDNNDEENAQFYRDMQRKHFSWYHKHLHWLRQQLIRHGVL